MSNSKYPLVVQFTGSSVEDLTDEDEAEWEFSYLDRVEAWLASLDPAVFAGLVRFAVECNGYCVGLTPEVEALSNGPETPEDPLGLSGLWAHYGISSAVCSKEWEDLEIDELLTSTRGYFFGDSGS